MSRSLINQTQRSLVRAIAFVIFLPCLWAFLGTIDGPAISLGHAASSVVYKSVKAPELQHSIQLGASSLGEYPEEPLIHSSFLLFAFKQNLRRWPNVAGDISRSPPFVQMI